MSWLRKIFSGNSNSRVSSQNPLIIDSPRIAFLNRAGPLAESLLCEDKQAFAGLFEPNETRADDVLDCDVLMIYCELAPDGMIGGEARGLRDLIDSSSATIVIVASQNSVESYMAAGKGDGHRPVNLVMTIDRKGNAFPQFFESLFRRMCNGESMLSAWVELAPQHAGAKHDDCPETILLPEISHIVFRHT